MAMTLQQLLAYREALLKMKFSGVSTVTSGDNSTTLRSIKDINDALATIDAEIGALSDTTKRVRSIRINTRDGY